MYTHAHLVVVKQCSNISETAKSIKVELNVEPPWVNGTKFVCCIWIITLMAATFIYMYGKNIKIFVGNQWAQWLYFFAQLNSAEHEI